MRFKVPEVSHILDVANIAEEPRKPMSRFNPEDINQAIISYYLRETNIPLSTYKFICDGESQKVNTSLYEDNNINIQNTEEIGGSFSDYTTKSLEATGLKTDDVWNGDRIAIKSTPNKLKFCKTDYYTSRTFSRLLFLESANALVENDGNQTQITDKDLPLRNKIISKKEDFFYETCNSPDASSGGVIVGKRDGLWRMLLSRRSDNVNINSGLVSVVPNGGVEYEDLNQDGFISGVRREFSEEILPSKELSFDERVKHELSNVGWNVRDGGLSVLYTLYVDDDLYENIYSNQSTNFEFSEMVELDIFDYDSVTNTINIDNMSSSTIPVVCDTLRKFNSEDSLPNLPYDIEKISD